MAKYKVVITDFGGLKGNLEEQEFQASGLDIEVVRLQCRTPEEVIPHVADADALMVLWVQINRKVMESMTRCKVITRYGIGVDMVDLKAASEKGIMVANCPDFCLEEVSTTTVAFLLSLNRHLIACDRSMRAGRWPWPQEEAYPSRLSTQVLGLVGLGNLGRGVARRAQGLGLTVIAYDPYADADQAAQLQVKLVGLDELLKTSDYVSLHCPLNDETRHLIGAAQLALMKPTAYLINMARGPVVDQPALYEALVKHTIAGAALDVLEQEPPAPDEPLFKLDNVILAPHAASASVQAQPQALRDSAQSVIAALQGKRPRSVVNAKALGLK